MAASLQRAGCRHDRRVLDPAVLRTPRRGAGVVKPVRVVIADDEALVRQALGELIAAESALELAGEAHDAGGVIELAREHRPDVALVDVRMPGGGGPRAAREIKLCSPLTRVVALSAYSDHETVIEMVRAGAVGYVVKGAPGREVVDAILSGARGETTLLAEITGVLDQRALTTVFQPIVRLTTGEMVGVEALSRFPDDLLSTEAWFKAAEAVGLQTELEILAVQTALEHLPSLREELYLAVNLSPKTLQVWPSIILEAGAKDRVVLELTEHARIEDYDMLERAISGARSDGARIAVDDVGAGFANLQRFRKRAPAPVSVDVSGERRVELDEVRSDVEDVLEVGEASADVVDRDACPVGASSRDRPFEHVVVLDACVFGELEDYAILRSRLEDDRRPHLKGLRREIDREVELFAQRGQVFERGLDSQDLQLGLETDRLGCLEPRLGAEEVVGEARERLYPDHLAGCQSHDRLEHGRQRPLVEHAPDAIDVCATAVGFVPLSFDVLRELGDDLARDLRREGGFSPCAAQNRIHDLAPRRSLDHIPDRARPDHLDDRFMVGVGR